MSTQNKMLEINEARQRTLELYRVAKRSPSLKVYRELVEVAHLPAEVLGLSPEKVRADSAIENIHNTYFKDGDDTTFAIRYFESKNRGLRWKKVGILHIPTRIHGPDQKLIGIYYCRKEDNYKIYHEDMGIERFFEDAIRAIG